MSILQQSFPEANKAVLHSTLDRPMAYSAILQSMILPFKDATFDFFPKSIIKCVLTVVWLRLSKLVPKPRFFGKTEPNRGFMPLCWWFRKRSCSSVLTVPWTLITRGLAGVAARVVGDCAGGDALLRVRGGGWGLERLNEWRTVRTGERRRTVGG